MAQLGQNLDLIHELLGSPVVALVQALHCNCSPISEFAYKSKSDFKDDPYSGSQMAYVKFRKTAAGKGYHPTIEHSAIAPVTELPLWVEVVRCIPKLLIVEDGQATVLASLLEICPR